MELHFGFYNSDPVTGTRTYSAEDMSRLLDGIITEGVFNTYGKSFNIVAPETFKEGEEDNTFSVVVGPGKAWYNGTWTMIDEDETLFLDIEEGPIDNRRVDEVILEVNTVTRNNRIFVLQGLPGADLLPPSVDEYTGVPALPWAPNDNYIQQTNPDGTPTHTDPDEGVYWYPLYYIIVPAGFGHSAASYNRNNIKIHKMEFDVVSSPIEHEDISSLYTEWRAAWVAWFQGIKDTWNSWFNTTKTDWDAWVASQKDAWDGIEELLRNL